MNCFAAFAFIVIGMGLKLAIYPLHRWLPGAYTYAPSAVSAFLAATATKVAIYVVIRFMFSVFSIKFEFEQDTMAYIFFPFAIIAMFAASFIAVFQVNVKRMLAYSSIGHAGFILVGVQAASPDGVAAVVFYAAAYGLLAVGSFGVLSIVSGAGDRSTALQDLDGLARRRPALALAFTVFLLAQAGVPLTTGFVAKFQVIGAAVEARSFWLAIGAMVTAVVSAFLYLRIVLSMYLGRVPDDATPIAVPRAAGVAIAIAVIFTVGFGVFPGELDDVTRNAVPQLLAGS